MKLKTLEIPQQTLNGQMQGASAIEIRKARRLAAASILLNCILAVAKGIAGIISGSSALMADAVHSATDVVGSAAAFVGLWLAGKQHPSFHYGLYKAETIATLITSIVVLIAAYEIGRGALLGPATLPEVALALPVAVVSLLVAAGFGFYQLRSGRKLHSKALEADARDYLADSLSTAVVLISLFGATVGLQLDRWAAGIVALFVFWSGGHLLWRALRDLLDEAIDRDTERTIIQQIEAHPKVDYVERCLSRTAGGRYIVELDVVFRMQSLDVVHRIAHHLERLITRKFPRVVMVAVRPHSYNPQKIKRVRPVQSPEGSPAPYMAKAPWFLVETVDTRTGEVIARKAHRNPHVGAETKRGYLVGKWLLSLKPDQLVWTDKREGTAVALLKEAGVDVIEESALAQTAWPPDGGGEAGSFN